MDKVLVAKNNVLIKFVFITSSLKPEMIMIMYSSGI